ncbi:MAG: lipoate--protein ligase family protein [Bacteroidales bacterium]|nr:lipoate--protein ligase family protein [Bacteroidales bacterium]
MNIVVSRSNTPAFNLAAEEYLFSRKEEDFLFLYRNEPSVIIGSNQAVLNEVDPDFCIENDIRIIRRLSGGGAVYHDLGNFNYSFIHGKTDQPLSARFLDPIVSALHAMGIPVEIRKRKDLWLGEYKVSGTASHLSGGRELHHGTLLYDSDLKMLKHSLRAENRNLIKKATASVVSPVCNIKEYLKENRGAAPDVGDFFKQWSGQLAILLNAPDILMLEKEQVTAIEVLQQEKYNRREWNYRK